MIKCGIECGQAALATQSWKRPIFRCFPKGFAIGPIMFWRNS